MRFRWLNRNRSSSSHSRTCKKTRSINYWSNYNFTLLNVFNERAPQNNVELFYAKLQDKVPLNRKLPRRKFGTSNHYLREEYVHHIEALHKKLEQLKPNVIVALGNTALWALGLTPSIAKLRGNVIASKWGKVIPTHHPGAVIRAWSNRTIAVLDLHKALRESKSPAISAPERIIWTEPTIEDLYKWWEDYGSKAELLAIDIETLKKIPLEREKSARHFTYSISLSTILYLEIPCAVSGF